MKIDSNCTLFQEKLGEHNNKLVIKKKYEQFLFSKFSLVFKNMFWSQYNFVSPFKMIQTKTYVRKLIKMW